MTLPTLEPAYLRPGAAATKDIFGPNKKGCPYGKGSLHFHPLRIVGRE